MEITLEKCSVAINHHFFTFPSKNIRLDTYNHLSRTVPILDYRDLFFKCSSFELILIQTSSCKNTSAVCQHHYAKSFKNFNAIASASQHSDHDC